MCGIAGVFGSDAAPVGFARLFAAVAHRGPDGSGIWRDERIHLGMNRLSFRGRDIALPVGCGPGVAAFNGQIYGRFTEAGSFEAADEDVASEVALACQSGADGMFACSKYIPARGEVVLRTDPHFIKPLFVRSTDGGFAFCSEMAPLLEQAGANHINFEALAELFAYGWYLTDRSWIEDVALVARDNVRITGSEIHRDPKPPLVPLQPEAEPLIALREAVRESVRRSTQGRGQLGLALSGGIDSTILAHELDALGIENLVCLTVRSGADEGLATLGELGLPPGGSWRSWRHVTVDVGDQDFLKSFEAGARAFAQPTTMSSLPLYCRLADAAAEEGVRALILGEGVDEYFAGYASYGKVAAIAHILDYYRHPPRDRLVRILFGNEAADGLWKRFTRQYAGSTDLRRIEVELRLTRLLLRTDVCLMARSIEGRVPFLYNRLPSIAMSLPWEKVASGGGKSVLRKAFARELGSRATQPKVRFKGSDAMLMGFVRDRAVRQRIMAGAGTILSAAATASALSNLAHPEGYDADIFCLLLSLTFLAESGVIRGNA